MIFDAGNNNLHEINILMNKINTLRGEIADINERRKRIITEYIVRVFNAKKQPVLTKENTDPLSQKSENKLINIESELEGLKSDIEKYRKNIKRSKLYFQEFKALTQAILCR